MNKVEEKDIIYYVNKLKGSGDIMNEEDKNECYNQIVFLLKQNNESVTSISTKLDKEYYSKIYELYHSFSQKKPEQDIMNSKGKFNQGISPSNNQKGKQNKINIKTCDFTLTEQDKRIKEYKNKFNSLTEHTNLDNSSDVFSNKNNFNFKGRINDENNQINIQTEKENNNENILFDLENRRRQLDEITKGNLIKSKSIMNSQSDIPAVNQTYLTSILMDNLNRNNGDFSKSIENCFMSQKSKNYELVKNMKKNLDHIRKRVTKNLNK